MRVRASGRKKEGRKGLCWRERWREWEREWKREREGGLKCERKEDGRNGSQKKEWEKRREGWR